MPWRTHASDAQAGEAGALGQLTLARLIHSLQHRHRYRYHAAPARCHQRKACQEAWMLAFHPEPQMGQAANVAEWNHCLTEWNHWIL